MSDTLISAYRHSPWNTEGQTQARCIPYVPYSAGWQEDQKTEVIMHRKKRCECGLYAFHQLNSACEKLKEGKIFDRGFPKGVLGAVMGWGKIVVHKEGFRSEFQKIIALGYNTEPSTELELFARQQQILII
jgi:hypothetical protein